MTTATHNHPTAVKVLQATRRYSVDLVLNILAICGVICIILVICAIAFNITLMMFKTGSMTPTIPQGSVAIVQEVPANTVHIGDIVTIDRGEDRLPVTHRIIDIEPGHNGATIITMKGDANPGPDPAPYEVTTVRRVLYHIPHLAKYIVKLSDPVVMGGITIGAALLVTWAFWPRRDDECEEGEDAANRVSSP